MDETTTNTNGTEAPAQARPRTRVRDMQESALSAVWDTPGWVWAVLGGVILLMLGILAASRYRARHREH